jgi:DNA invertase Pin-like site-specific DNA recombinase
MTFSLQAFLSDAHLLFDLRRKHLSSRPTKIRSRSSIADQVRLCRARAQREGWSVVEVYSDAAMSGTSKDRPAYLQMVSDALSGQFDLVLAEAMDRLARSGVSIKPW